MKELESRPWLLALGGFVIGLIVGLFVLGWWLVPVEYEGTNPEGLYAEYQEVFLRTVAELYSFDNNQDKVRTALAGWGGDAVACELAANSTDPGEQQRYIAVATIINGQGCAAIAAPVATGEAGEPVAGDTLGGDAEPTGEESSSNLLPLLLLGLLLLLLLVAIGYVYTRRRALLEEPVSEGYEAIPASARATDAKGAPAVMEATAVPIARFRTSYTRGHDTYDDSFSIENAAGDFLGECGVGISETLGAESPKNVTAFEVWLFDKNDIRTITKVIMSDHAFFDDALKAKLAPKGEPVLARENETIVLETASLIINAEISEMDYGSNPNLPDASYFERFTIELSAWAKETDYSGSEVAEQDDLLSY